MPTSMQRAEDVRAIVGPDHVRTAEAVPGYRIGGVSPSVVAFPGDEIQVARLLALAWRERLGVVPWGGGTHQSIGKPPLRYDLAMDLTRMDRLLEHEPADMTATAQAGIRMPELQRHLERYSQFLPLDPPRADRATLGGVLATRLSGPLACRYGTTRDLILGVRVAHADGTITKGGGKVVKNASAYDMTKLYLGSHGTLAVILQATFRVYPCPASEEAWWLAAPGVEAAQSMAIRILRSPLAPTRVELVDGPALEVLGGPPAPSALLVSFSGVPEAVQAQASDLAGTLEEFGVTPTPVRLPARGWSVLSDFPWAGSAGNGTPYDCVWRASVLPADCARALRAVRQSTGPFGRVAAVASVAHGILRVAFRANSEEATGRALAAARQALKAMGGLLVVVEAPEPIRSECDIWGTTPDALGVMERIKADFDPRRVLNPGRFVGGI